MANSNGKKVCLYAGVGIFGLVAIIFIVIACALTPITDTLIKSTVNDQVFLKESNKNTWGEVPGQYELFIARNISIFNYTNAKDSYLNSEKPVFKLTTELPFRETQSVSDLTPSADGSTIAMNQRIMTSPYNLTSEQEAQLNTKLKIPNIAALGAWDTLKNYNASKLAAGAFSGMITALTRDDTMLLSALSTAVFDLFITNRAKCDAMIFDNVHGLSEEQKDRLWEDPNYGFQGFATMNGWMHATQLGPESNVAILMANHFNLNRGQSTQIINSLKSASSSAMLTMVNLFDCPNAYCSSKHLAAVQWASQNVSAGVPLSAIEPMPSITYLNMTVFGYPEFSYYYKK